MHLDNIIAAIKANKIRWKRHALNRMIERGIEIDEVLNAIKNGEIIEPYEDASPLPCYLIFGYGGNKPMHVVAAWDDIELIVYIITVYVPDASQWHHDWRTRRGL